MKRILLCGKHELIIPDFEDNPKHKSGDRHTSYRAYLRDGHGYGEITKGAATYHHIIQTYKALMGGSAPRVVDYFGGLGMSAILISCELDVETFNVYEVDEQLVEHLRMLPHNFDVAYGDSWALIRDGAHPESDIVNFDPQSFYGSDWINIPDAKRLWEVGHKAIIMADVTPHFFHIPSNRKAHTLGISDAETIDGYFVDLADYLLGEFGYKIVQTIYWGSCARHFVLRGDLYDGEYMRGQIPLGASGAYVPASTVEDIG